MRRSIDLNDRTASEVIERTGWLGAATEVSLDRGLASCFIVLLSRRPTAPHRRTARRGHPCTADGATPHGVAQDPALGRPVHRARGNAHAETRTRNWVVQRALAWRATRKVPTCLERRDQVKFRG